MEERIKEEVEVVFKAAELFLHYAGCVWEMLGFHWIAKQNISEGNIKAAFCIRELIQIRLNQPYSSNSK